MTTHFDSVNASRSNDSSPRPPSPSAPPEPYHVPWEFSGPPPSAPPESYHVPWEFSGAACLHSAVPRTHMVPQHVYTSLPVPPAHSWQPESVQVPPLWEPLPLRSWELTGRTRRNRNTSRRGRAARALHRTPAQPCRRPESIQAPWEPMHFPPPADTSSLWSWGSTAYDYRTRNRDTPRRGAATGRGNRGRGGIPRGRGVIPRGRGGIPRGRGLRVRGTAVNRSRARSRRGRGVTQNVSKNIFSFTVYYMFFVSCRLIRDSLCSTFTISHRIN